jgi:hypothetical protein
MARRSRYLRYDEHVAALMKRGNPYMPVIRRQRRWNSCFTNGNTRHGTYDYEGIKIHNLSDWLLKIE